MRALITGGAGFIGSHLSERLIGGGHHVTVLDDLSTGSLRNVAHLRNHPRFRCQIGSVSNEELVASLVAHTDVVFHLAAAVGVKLVTTRPVHTIETNMNGTEIVLRQASRHKKLVVVASTSEVYGKSQVFPFREDADLVLGASSKTRWGYATSKLLDEFLALGYWKEFQTPVIVVRLFNTVGPRQSSRYGMVLPNFVQWALDGSPITIHGDGSQRRSFTWVGDVVSGLIGLVHESSAVGEVFNIGNGAEISIRDLATRVKEMTGSKSPLTFVPYAKVFDNSFEDMQRRVPDISKLNRFIGYAPTVHLDEIIERTIDYWTAERQRTADMRPAALVAAAV